MRHRLTQTHIWISKSIIHSLSLGLLLLTFYQALNDQLGADPVQQLIHFTGMGAINLVLLSLLVSPVAKLSKQGALMRLRRVIGLYGFFYAVCHLASYLLFDLQNEWTALFDDIVKRPYITVGFTAFLILLLLACTSYSGIQRRLGKTWQRLHNWVYLAVALAGLHFWWSVKSGLLEVALYGCAILLLLLMRKAKLSRYLQRS